MSKTIKLILIDLGFKSTYESIDELGISKYGKKTLILIGFNQFSSGLWGEVGDSECRYSYRTISRFRDPMCVSYLEKDLNLISILLGVKVVYWEEP